MAIQYPNFEEGKTNFKYRNIPSLADSLAEGYKLGKIPQQMSDAHKSNQLADQFRQAQTQGLQQQQQQNERMNPGALQHQQQQNQYYPQQQQDAHDLSQANTYKARQPASTSTQWELKQGDNGNYYRVNKMTGDIQPIKQGDTPFQGKSSGMSIILPDGTQINEGGSGSGRGGKSYVDSKGQVVVTPTNATQTDVQKRLAATRDLQKNIKDVLAKTGDYPYYGLHGKLSDFDKGAIEWGMGNVFGSEDRRKIAGDFQVEQFNNLERMVTSAGIRATQAAIQQAADALAIKPGMSEKEVIGKYESALRHLRKQEGADAPRQLGLSTGVQAQGQQSPGDGQEQKPKLAISDSLRKELDALSEEQIEARIARGGM